VTGLVYASVRGVTRLVGGGLDLALAQLAVLLDQRGDWPERDIVVAALNGVLGDHLAATGNPLATPMGLRRAGAAGGRVLVLIHGSSMCDRQWLRNGHDHGAALAADVGLTPVYLRYNSGLHISTNGRMLAELLEGELAAWPVPIEELSFLCHSMGGLVARSACHHASAAGHAWLRKLRRVVFLGTPHHGAPLERGGHWIDVLLGLSPYSAPIGRLGRIRSAGVTDLRHGSLVDEDWVGRERFGLGSARNAREVPLPDGVACYAIAADAGRGSDGLVPVDSALGRKPGRQLTLADDWVATGMGHLDLLDRAEVYAKIRQWFGDGR